MLCRVKHVNNDRGPDAEQRELRVNELGDRKAELLQAACRIIRRRHVTKLLHRLSVGVNELRHIDVGRIGHVDRSRADDKGNAGRHLCCRQQRGSYLGNSDTVVISHSQCSINFRIDLQTAAF